MAGDCTVITEMDRYLVRGNSKKQRILSPDKGKSPNIASDDEQPRCSTSTSFSNCDKNKKLVKRKYDEAI